MIVSSAVFCLGLYNVMTRRNAVAILMGIELILNAANINFIAFNRFNGLPILDGHIMSVFVIVLAAAEAAVALAIIINLYRNIGSVEINNRSTSSAKCDLFSSSQPRWDTSSCRVVKA